MKKVNLALLFTALFPVISAHADDGDYGMMDGMYHMMSGSYGWGWGIFGWLIGFLIIVALVLLIIWLMKQIQKK